MKYLNYIGFIFLSSVAISCFTDENADPLNENTFIRVYSDSDNNLSHSVIELEDGFVCLATATRSSADGTIISKVKLIRTTANGSPIWTSSFPTADSLGNYRAAGLVYDGSKIIVLADLLVDNNPSKPAIFEVDVSGGLIGSEKQIVDPLLAGKSFTGKAVNLSETNDLIIGLDVFNPAAISSNEFSMAILKLDINNDYTSLSASGVGKGAIYRMSKSIFEYEGAMFFAATRSSTGQMTAWKMIGNDPIPIPINLQNQETTTAQANQIQFFKQTDNQAGFAVIGTITNNSNIENVVFAKLNQNAQIIGEEKILESQQQNNRRGISIASTTDNGFILGETTASGPANSITVTKVNASGNIVWEQVFDRASNSLTQVIATRDRGTLVLGNTVFGSTQQSILLYKVNSSGEFTTN